MNGFSLDLFALTASFWVFAGCQYDGSLVHIVLKRIGGSCQRSTSISVSENFEEKLFVQFLVLIYLSYIKKQMDEKGLYKKYTMQTLLDDLDIIELYQQPGRAHHLSEITKKQMALYDAMGVPFLK